MRVCYSEQMRNVDRIAIEEYNVPGIVLMENAAIASVCEIEKQLNKKSKISVFCGKGNNGGDGLAIARHLFNKGYDVCVYLVDDTAFSPDALINYNIIRKMGIKIDSAYNADFSMSDNDVIVDAIFGTGFKGEIDGQISAVVEMINKSEAYVFSVDVPSGIDADTGMVSNNSVKADKTISLAAYKTGLLMYPAFDYAGEIVVKDISIPDEAFCKVGTKVFTTDKEFFRANMPAREKNSHKGDYGKLLVIAGSKGLSGAAYLSSQAAMLSGSGLVSLITPNEINGILERKTTEVMTIPVPSLDGHISVLAKEIIENKISNFDAVLFGPGLGNSKDVQEIVKMLLEKATVPLIIDADGINALANFPHILKTKKCPVILTPHSMEFSRISKIPVLDIEKDRLGVSKAFSEEFDVTLVLKGSHTIVTAPDGMQYINMTGNPGMATGGSGDVLGGIIASLVARGIPCHKASAMGTYIHGVCGDMAKNEFSEDSLIATDILNAISKAFNHILQVEK